MVCGVSLHMIVGLASGRDRSENAGFAAMLFEVNSVFAALLPYQMQQ